MNNKRSLGALGEQIVRNHYTQNGYHFIESNFTIRGGEIDLIFTKNNLYYFIEVKVVNGSDDIFDYVTKNKLKFLKKTIDSYIYKYKIINEYRLNVVFVKDNEIFEIYSNIDFEN